MKQEFENYVKHCEICHTRPTQKKTKLSLQITDTSEVVRQNCSLDIVGPLTQTSQNITVISG